MHLHRKLFAINPLQTSAEAAPSLSRQDAPLRPCRRLHHRLFHALTKMQSHCPLFRFFTKSRLDHFVKFLRNFFEQII